MPEYVYRREDGSTFSIRQKFSDDPLNVDPETGQKVVRIVQNAGVIFKGSGFYITDNKNSNGRNGASRNGNGASSTTSDDKPASSTKSETKTETKKESLAAAGD